MNHSSAEQREKIIVALGDIFSSPGNAVEPANAELLAENNLEALCFHFSSGEVPEGEVFARIREQYRKISRWQFVQNAGKELLFSQMEQEQIPFVPIKGLDLAFRIYPDPALRFFIDWDIWVRKEDLKRFLSFLKAKGWSCHLDAYSEHHCGMRKKGRYSLEPHFSLPNFLGVEQEELWAMTEVSPGKMYQRHLSDELNLMMLFQHNAISHFQSSEVLKILLDFEFLLRKSDPDWELISKLSKKWRIPHPGLLIAAFPEFFRGRYEPGITFPGEAVDALRELLLKPRKFSEESAAINRFDARVTDRFWLKSHFRHYFLGNLCWRYPSLKRFPWAYPVLLGYDIARKVPILLSGKRRISPPLKRHLQMAGTVENSWRDLPEKP